MLLCLTTVIGCTLCTLRCSCVWRMYPSHWLYPLYSKMLMCLTTVIGCTLCTLRCSCVWRMYPSHWLYPLHSKMLLCLTYASQSLVVPSTLEDAPVFDVCIQSLVVPSTLEDAPVFDECIPVIGCTLCTLRCSCVWRMYPSHWLYPLHSKILLCLTYVSQSLVVPSVLEDAPVFDVCIPVIGCTLCTRRYSCVWRMYPSHWLYPLYSKMLLCLTYVSQSLVYPLYSKILLCLTYVSQSLVVPSVL